MIGGSKERCLLYFWEVLKLSTISINCSGIYARNFFLSEYISISMSFLLQCVENSFQRFFLRYKEKVSSVQFDLKLYIKFLKLLNVYPGFF